VSGRASRAVAVVRCGAADAAGIFVFNGLRCGGVRLRARHVATRAPAECQHAGDEKGTEKSNNRRTTFHDNKGKVISIFRIDSFG